MNSFLYRIVPWTVVVVQSFSPVQLFATRDGSTAGLCPSPSPEFAQVHVHCICDVIYISHSLTPSSLALNLSQQQTLFQ